RRLLAVRARAADRPEPAVAALALAARAAFAHRGDVRRCVLPRELLPRDARRRRRPAGVEQSGLGLSSPRPGPAGRRPRMGIDGEGAVAPPRPPEVWGLESLIETLIPTRRSGA